MFSQTYSKWTIWSLVAIIIILAVVLIQGYVTYVYAPQLEQAVETQKNKPQITGLPAAEPPPGFPANLVLAGAQTPLESFMVRQGQTLTLVRAFESQLSVEKNREQYEKFFTDNKWQGVSAKGGAANVTISASNGQKTATVNILKQDQKVIVRISYILQTVVAP